ncbi:MAG: hypothetical protein WC934_06225 [Acidithiobacillus sp.]|jgi:hypothetical protein|uniref:hypothetical protein n=1 Tax=Acidithiobacillus sp. TaxID=1872118 RepID=UPI00355F4B94
MVKQKPKEVIFTDSFFGHIIPESDYKPMWIGREGGYISSGWMYDITEQIMDTLIPEKDYDVEITVKCIPKKKKK